MNREDNVEEKAKEWAEKRVKKMADGAVREMREELEVAYLAGYRAGTTDAHRKEFRQDMQENFSRGLGQ